MTETAIKKELPATAVQLLLAAERLLADKGLGAVSTREIAREAGQKNHSALNYHFGSREGLIEAILDYRMTPLNHYRQQRLEQLKHEGKEQDLRCLLSTMIEPFAEELLKPPEESYYLRLLAQLMSQREWMTLFTSKQHRSSAALEAGSLVGNLLRESLDEVIVLERLRLLGLHILNTITEWDAMRRRSELLMNEENLQWRVQNLIDYLVAGLNAPVNGS